MLISKISNYSSNIYFKNNNLNKKQTNFMGNNIPSIPLDSIEINKTSGNNKNTPENLIKQLSNLLKNKKINAQDVLALQETIYNLPEKQKEDFIKLYCAKTGFPNMQKTSLLIVENVTSSLLKAAETTGVEVVFAGYNPTCSVANGHALPGSDFDTFFVCLKNWDNFDNFKEEFEKNINPLLCSITHARTNDLPDFVVLDDINSSIDVAQKIFNQKGLNKNSNSYNQTLDTQIKDWRIAGKYNLDVNEFVEDKDKTPLLRAGLLMEIYRDGAVIVDNLDKKTKEKFKNSCVYNYSNMQQMRSYKNAPLKNKHKNRKEILSSFSKLSADEKLKLIFDVINLSVKNLKGNVSDENKPMFNDAGCGNMEDLMQPLLSNKHRLLEYRN